MPLTAGTRLGPYQIDSAIGAGGMGEVYRAKDTRLERTVAIKVLPPHLASGPEFRERFEREAKSISSLNHPNICTLYDVGRESDTDYLVLEYIEGESLAQRLAKGPLPLAGALKIAIEIASALERAHSQGIVHRDLKPGNVMLTGTGAKLLDFGLAKSGPVMPLRSSSPGTGIAARTPATSMPTVAVPLTVQGTMMGTFQYMAPEQIEGADASPRTDIWALGCVIFEMVTGKRAFEGKSRAVLIAAIATEDPDPLSPPALEHVVRRCLAKDADDRWQTAHDLLIQLRWIAGGNTEAVPVAAPAAKSQKLTRMILIAAGLLIGALAYPAVQYFRGPADPGAFQFRVRARGLSTADIALSADGRTMALVIRPDTSEPASLYTRRLNAVTFQKLGGTEDASQPFFSPDGHYIAFVSKGKLKRVNVAGGAPQSIADVPGFSGGAWNRDGAILYGSARGLYRVSAEGGTPAAVTTPGPQETGHLWPRFLPDGHHFIYLSWSGQTADRGVFLGDLGSKDNKRLMPAESNAIYSAPGYLVFHRAASLFAQPFDESKLVLKGEAVHLADEVESSANGRGHFDVSLGGMLLYYQGGDSGGGRANTQTGVQLAWLNRNGSTVGFAGDPGPYGDMDVSPDGKLIALTEQATGTTGADIWVIDWQRAGVATRLTLDPADDMGPVWSPDGKRIAFTSYRKGNADIYVKNANGMGLETPLLESPADEIVRDWSKDERYMAYLSGQDEFHDIYVLPLADGKPAADQKPIPVVQGHFHKDEPQFSYDGKWMAYVSDETGMYQVNVVSFPALDQKLQVSVNGGGQPRWRKDGKELYFRDINRGGIMAVDIKPGAKLDASPPHELFQPAYNSPWAIDPIRHLLGVTPDGQNFLLRVFARAQGGGAGQSSAPVVQTFVSAPGQNATAAGLARVAVNNNGLTVIQHWTSALGKAGAK